MGLRGAGDGYEMDSETGVAPSAERIKKDEAIVTPKGANLTWNVIPSIPYVSTAEAAQGTHKAAKPAEDVDTKIAKEIEVAKPTAKAAKATEVKSAPVKVSLPKLALSDQDIQAKLGEHGGQPNLPSDVSSKRVDPEILKQRLIEKEAAASENRAREISRMQSKLARQDEHARRVLQRKRALGRLSTEDLNLSWGGEDGLETLELSLEEEVRRPKTAACDFDDVDSGNGVGTNGEIIEDMKAIQVAPLQDRYRIISQ
ncbi:hypothetical protein BC829DRAFT_378595 [Chytridium lagenaria]|nr:hypothetical protein BC829DRAFT_378595 [Chytridium lagenaria]